MRPNHQRRRSFSAPVGVKGRKAAAASACMAARAGEDAPRVLSGRRRSAGPPPLLWPYPYHLFPRIVRPLCRFQRYSCPARAARRVTLRPPARIPCAAYPCVRPRLLCGLTLRAAGFACRVTLRVRRPRPPRGLTLRAAGFVRRVTLRARPRPLRGLSLPDAGSVCRVALRPPVFSCVPREGRILAVSQRVPCPPRRPARPNPAHRGFCPSASPARASAFPAQPYPCAPPAAGFCPSAAGRADIGREPAHAVPAASPCARRLFPAPRGKGGYWQRASACRAHRVALRAARRRVLSACRGKGGYWQ